MKNALLLLLLCSSISLGQFTSTARHIAPGASLPATCQPGSGDVYFKTSATISVYYCSAANTWTQMAAGPGGGGSPASPANSIQFNNAGAFGGSANLTWNNATGTFTIGTSFLNVPGLTSPAPTLTPVGADNGVTYSYFCVARSLYGPAAPGSTVTTTHGPTTLSGTDKINITCALTASAVNGCDIYRTVGGADNGFIGNVACDGATILADAGQVSTAVVPTTEASSGVILNGSNATSVPHGVDSASNPLGIVNISGDSATPSLANIQYGYDGSACQSAWVFQNIVSVGPKNATSLTYDNCNISIFGPYNARRLTFSNRDAVIIGNADIGTHDNSDMIAIGAGAGKFLTHDNTRVYSIGYSAGPGASNNEDAVIIGSQAGHRTGDTGGNSSIVAIGSAAGQTFGSNFAITAVGYAAGATISAGSQRLTYIGTEAGSNGNPNSATHEDAIVAIGYQAVYHPRGGNNNIIAIGLEPMANGFLVNAANDIAIGTATLQECTGCVNDIAIGDNAGQLITTGTQNLLLGRSAGSALTTETGNVLIGFNAGANLTASNKLYIDNSNTATPLIGGDFSARTLTFTAAVSATSWGTATNCASAASPAICSSAPAGAVAIPTGVTSVALVVNTTAVTANSRITLLSDDSLTIPATTCNSTLATLVGGLAVTARTAGTSFTITYNGTIATNPLCVSYSIVN